MAMEWLKGLVGPMAQFPAGGPSGAPAYPQAYGTPPLGGAPQAPPGAPGPGAPPGAWGPPQQAWGAGGAAPPAYGAPPTYDAPPAYGAPQPYNAPHAYSAQPVYNQSPSDGASPPSPARVTELENRCEALQRDLESLALFAQTLLAVLEDKKLMTQQDFQEMRRKLDLMDGRLDDRIARP